MAHSMMALALVFEHCRVTGLDQVYFTHIGVLARGLMAGSPPVFTLVLRVLLASENGFRSGVVQAENQRRQGCKGAARALPRAWRWVYGVDHITESDAGCWGVQAY